MTTTLPKFQLSFGNQIYFGEIGRVSGFTIDPGSEESHGFFSVLLNFEFGGSGQGMPGMGLVGVRRPGRPMSELAGTANYLYRLLSTIGSPEEAKGRPVVILRESDHYSAPIVGFCALNADGTYGPAFFNRFESEYME